VVSHGIRLHASLKRSTLRRNKMDRVTIWMDENDKKNLVRVTQIIRSKSNGPVGMSAIVRLAIKEFLERYKEFL
jgi:hypothetical protein